MHKKNAQQGFTLLEISIVMGLIALITAGILIGKTLEKAAQVNQAAAMYSEFLGAWNNFKTAYNGIPGDITNATEFWGVDSESCPLLSGVATSSGTCNGNGDGKINWYGAGGGGEVPALANSVAEASMVFQQLMFAGFLKLPVNREVNYDEFPYYVYPKFRNQSRASWYVGSEYARRADLYPSDTEFQGSDMTGNGLQTAVNLNNAGQQPLAAVANPALGMGIDTKIDDGLPRAGKFHASNAVPYSNSDFDDANLQTCFTDYGSGNEYNLSLKTDACRFIMQLDP